MFLMSAIAYLDRVNISYASEAIQKEYGLTNVQFGWVFSAFVLGYALFQAPGGLLADKFGPRIVIAVGVVWWGVFTTLTAQVPTNLAWSLGLMIVVRFLLGLGEAVVYPSSNRLVANWIPSAERGIANGLIFAGVGAGAGITPPLILWILTTWGWRWSFYISALLGFVVGVGWYVLARDAPRNHPLATPEEVALIGAGIPPVDEEAKSGLPWSVLLLNGNLLAITVSYFTYGYVAYIFFTWFYRYLSRVRGLDLKSSMVYSMLPYIAMAVASPLGGWVADRLTERYGKRAGRCGVAVFGIATAGIFLGLATQVGSAQLASIVLAGGAGALYLSQSAFWAVTADIAGPSAGTASGIMNMGGQLGGALTASLTPWIADHFGWTPSFLVAGGLGLFGSVLWLFVNPNASIGKLRTESAGR
jgi:ACS family glucarate transporter-like MFS transporter